MNRDKIFSNLNFSSEFSVKDWDALIKLKLGKYFNDDLIFQKNKELLRTEIINYLRFCSNHKYLKLFERTLDLYNECIKIEKQKIIKIIADSFHFTSNTDLQWMTNVITQPDSEGFSDRDKVSYYFKVINETLEGVFKPRFKLLNKIVQFKLNNILVDNSNYDFGKLVREFPIQFKKDFKLFLEDPVFSISINQWRNIATHKSFTILKDNIVVEYGQGNIQKLTLSFKDFYNIVQWTQDIYRVIRLGQVIIDLNYIKEIVDELGGTNNINVRLESTLLQIIHNMQIVGFEFVSTEEQIDTFCLNVKGKIDHDLKSSLIHASQCLDKLSCAIYDDEFIRSNFQRTKIFIVDDDQNKLASASISIEVALRKVKSEINLDEYLSCMNFDLELTSKHSGQ